MSEYRAHSGQTAARAALKQLATCFALLMAAVSCTACPSPPQAGHGKCREERQFTGADYWFWEGYQGVEDVRDDGDVRLGRLKSDPQVCFRAPLAETKEPMARTRGYKRAAAEWLAWLTPISEEWQTNPTALSVRKRIAALVGLDFPSYVELRAWWIENNDYLVWSDKARHLVINEAARAARRPIAPLNPVQEPTAERYWFFQGMDWLSDVTEDDKYIYAEAWAGDRSVRIRVSLGVVADWAAKERGYKAAVGTIIEERLPLRELGEPGAKGLMQRLQAITGQTFSDRQSWINWWKANRGNLVLSGDGRRLVVKSRPS